MNVPRSKLRGKFLILYRVLKNLQHLFLEKRGMTHRTLFSLKVFRGNKYVQLPLISFLGKQYVFLEYGELYVLQI